MQMLEMEEANPRQSGMPDGYVEVGYEELGPLAGRASQEEAKYVITGRAAGQVSGERSGWVIKSH